MLKVKVTTNWCTDEQIREEKRIEYIREEKKRLMNERNVLNIIDKIIKKEIL